MRTALSSTIKVIIVDCSKRWVLDSVNFPQSQH